MKRPSKGESNHIPREELSLGNQSVIARLRAEIGVVEDDQPNDANQTVKTPNDEACDDVRVEAGYGGQNQRRTMKGW